MKYDLAIAGSGPAGAIAALVAKRRGLSVALIDREAIPSRKVGESLIAAARPLLSRLGLLAIIENGDHLPCYGNVSAWGSNELVTTDFIRDPNGLGWHLNRDKFDETLRQSAREAGADLLPGTVKSLERANGVWKIQTGSHIVEASWIIDASGRSAALATKLGASFSADFPIMAAVTWMKPAKRDSDSRTFIEATEMGWWYTSRLPDHSRIVSFHTLPELVVEMVQAPTLWENALRETTHISQVTAGAKRFMPVKGLQACGGRLDRFHGEGWLATGDAALSLDPLSSQGLFNALYTGMRAAEAVASGSALEYVMRLEAIRDAYLQNRRYIYSTETRWITSPFWSTQHGHGPAHSITAVPAVNGVMH